MTRDSALDTESADILLEFLQVLGLRKELLSQTRNENVSSCSYFNVKKNDSDMNVVMD